MSSNNSLSSIAFDMPKNQSNVIKVIGVGGGGSNAINHMFQQGIKGVDFVICNTDAQALENSQIPNKIQLGVSLTEGLGAGANPEVGQEAAIESFEDIKVMLGTNTKMVFITAGMGGGTGTGAAPVLAKMARDMNILTVGIVTIPFQFEGRMRTEQAQIGVEKLRANVDSLIVINNNKLREVYGNLGFKAGFSKADEVLATASRGIAEVITHHYTQNIDLRDAKTVLSNSGTAIMGSATASGAQRSHDAIAKALDSPLLNDNKIKGAKNVLLLIVSGKEEITIDEIGEINDYIQQEAGYGANIIMGVGDDETLDDSVSVTVIATGFDIDQQDEIVNTETKKIIHSLSDEHKVEQQLSSKNTSSVFIPKQPVNTSTSAVKLEENVEIEKTEVKQEETIIRHELTEEPEPIVITTPKEIVEDPIIETTQAIQELVVIDAEEVLGSITSPEKEEFVIIDEQQRVNEINVVDAQEILPSVNEDQMALTFDFSTVSEVENSQVVDEIEEQPTPQFVDLEQTTEAPIIRHVLKEESVVETIKETIKEEEVIFEKRTVNQSEIKFEPAESELETNVDPMNQSISEVLRSRATERRAHMKEFNYKFRSSPGTNIDDIEKQPAYKRAGLDLGEQESAAKISRTTLSTDSNDELQLRKNNSFLHDNVD